MFKKFATLTRQYRGYKTGVYLTYFLIAVFILGPAIWITIQAFKTRVQIFAWPPVWIPWPGTLDHFIRLFTKRHFERALINSVLVSAGSSCVALGFATVAAYGFSRLQFKYKYLLLILLIGLQMVPATVNIIPWFFMSHYLGLHNTQLGVILLIGGMSIPFDIWILKGFFDSVPISIEENAALDGASRLRILTSILLPLILPGLSAAFFITFVGAWNYFIIPAVVIGDNSKQVAVVIAYQILSWEIVNPGMVAAAAVTTTFPMLLIFYGFQKLFVEGLTSGYGK